MDLASAYYLGVTFLFCAVFAAIVARVYSPKHKESGESAKFRMMEEGLPLPRREGESQKGGCDVRSQ